jgi:predicted Zn-dependent protease
MPAPAPARSAVASFVRRTTMQSILGLDEGALDQVMATAYLLYQSGRYAEVDVLCRGLIAADHTYWWSYSLHAAALRRLGRLDEALAQIDNGLSFEPAEKKLQLMRGEILAAIGTWKDRAAHDESPSALMLPGTTASSATVSEPATLAVGG